MLNSLPTQLPKFYSPFTGLCDLCLPRFLAHALVRFESSFRLSQIYTKLTYTATNLSQLAPLFIASSLNQSSLFPSASHGEHNYVWIFTQLPCQRGCCFITISILGLAVSCMLFLPDLYPISHGAVSYSGAIPCQREQSMENQGGVAGSNAPTKHCLAQKARSARQDWP